MQARGKTTSWVVLLFLQNYQIRHMNFKFKYYIHIGTLLLQTFKSVYIILSSMGHNII